MKNRSSYAVLTRFGIIAAILATLVLIAPVVSATDPLKFKYDENGEDPVATFTASDEDADAGDIAWSLEGVDADDFEIEGGVLEFKSPPNYESPTDRDEDTTTSVLEGAGDRKYQITVVASGGKQPVEVEVINLNEDGKVTFTQLQAQATRDLMAKFTDDDGEDDPTWQWSRGDSAEGPFTAISGATSADRSPTEDDLDMWLQATVSYTDSFGSASASGVIGPVVEETLANAAPSFSAHDDDDDTSGVQIALTFGENKKGKIGDPLTATDANGDPRLYTKTGGADAACFSIGETSGQLSLNAERNFESPLAACETGGAARTNEDDTATDDVDERQQYVVMITATDPSGAMGHATVTVTITDANEVPEFAGPAKHEDNVTLYIDENEKINETPLTDGNELALRQNEVDQAELATPGANAAVVAYTATDPDAETLDLNTQIRYKVEGPDAKQFTINGGTGVLGFAASEDLATKGADFEGDPSYSITIVATSGGTTNTTDTPPVPNRVVEDVDRTRIATLDVTIMVVDQEDQGTVTIDMPEPQEGKPILASLGDKDGGETGVTWQWSRIAALAADDTNQPPDADSDPDPVKTCEDVLVVTGTAGREWADISGATSPIYTPGSDTYDHDGNDDTDEVGYCLRATATYTDDYANPADDDATAGVDESKDTAMASPTRRVQDDDPANTAPDFNDDQDPNTPGKQPVAERSVPENEDGAKAGEPVVAEDVDLLMYSDDSDYFKVDNNGQITTAMELDYESLPEDAKYYMVTLTATDPSGASDTVMVKIHVTDGPDPAVITGVMTVKYDENGEDPVATFTASDEDADAGDIAWSLEGVDADDFEIEGGVLEFKSPPNYESPTDRDEDTTTSVLEGAGDRKYQITVVASGGKQPVEVEVINLNEDGKVTFTQLQAQATRDLMAKFTDDDGEDDPTWQWSRGDSAEGPFTAISGATSADRSPTEDDLDMWLQATVSYTDSFGSASASGVIGPVVEETLANAAPSFSAHDDDDDTSGVQIALTFGENKKGKIGDPLTATDANGDPRLYTKTGGADAACFSIGETSGQLSLNAERNFESPLAACETGGAARTNEDDTATDDVDERQQYVVMITATDPSGAMGHATVTVTITDANEVPEFAGPAKHEDNVTLYIDENEKINETPLTDGNELALRQNEVDQAELATPGANAAVVAYTATDPDAETLDLNTQIRYKVEGPDAKQFTINGGTGVLGFAASEDLATKGADFEGDPSYSITIVATSGGTTNTTDTPPVPNRVVEDVDRTRIATLDVTIMVVDQEDQGTVTIDMPEPQEGKPILASLGDKDGGETGVTWQWSRIAALAADDTNQPPDADSDPDPVKTCEDVLVVTGTAGREWADISGATSPIYTPGSDTYDHDGNDDTDEVGYCLRATATYTDDYANPADDDATAGVDESKDTAMASPTRRVQDDDPANTAPDFNDDQDPNTPGKQPVAERSVPENEDGAKAGEPVVAEDVDLLMYSDDSDYFKVDNNGQITTAMELDYESLPEDAKYYMVTLTATDPSGASDTVMVKIHVTDGPDVAVITLSVPPEFTDGEATERSVAENSEAGTPVGDPVAATDANGDDVTYSLGGDDMMYFEIDEMSGQISVGEGTMLDYESDKMSYSVTVTAEDETGRSSMIAVTIMVTDVEESPCVVGGAVAQAHSGSGLDMDCQTLLGIMDDLVGDGTALNWSDETPIADWQGVSSRGGTDRVYSIYLRGHGLAGMIPAGISGLDALTSLQLHNNMLTGEIPDLGDLDNLERLVLNDNMLSGSIPASLGDMAKLDYLYLHRNELSGSIPAELGNATDLRRIWLHGNMLSGEIPSELGNLSDRLRYLVLSSNMLTGEIPAELGNAIHLKQIYLDNNMLSGMIPAELGSIMDDSGTLLRLYVRNNMLTGMIPSELGMLTDLTHLRLSGNMLEGCVPAAIADAVDDGLDLMACADDGS